MREKVKEIREAEKEEEEEEKEKEKEKGKEKEERVIVKSDASSDLFTKDGKPTVRMLLYCRIVKAIFDIPPNAIGLVLLLL